MFQTSVGVNPAPATPGDFASANVRVSVLAGPGELIAGPSGVLAGRFAWATSVTPDAVHTVANSGSGPPTGFLANEHQGLNQTQTWLSPGAMLIPAGSAVTLYSAGDFYVTNSGDSQVTPGMTAFADPSTGLVTFGTHATIDVVGTKWVAASFGAAGEVVKISSFADDARAVLWETGAALAPGAGITADAA
jgi:hypothetical protein